MAAEDKDIKVAEGGVVETITNRVSGITLVPWRDRCPIVLSNKADCVGSTPCRQKLETEKDGHCTSTEIQKSSKQLGKAIGRASKDGCCQNLRTTTQS